MPEKGEHRFVVGCRGCRRTLMTVARLRDEDVVDLEAHLRGCAASVPLRQTATLEDILRRLRIQAGDGT